MKITLVTGNESKIADWLSIASFPFDVCTLSLPEIQGTPKEISLSKAKYAYDILQKPVCTDDVSFCCATLMDLPGPYIKHFLPLGLKKLVAIVGEDTECYAMCNVGYCDGINCISFEGITRGRIVYPRNQGPGWDPIFEPYTTKPYPFLTYAQMGDIERNKISERRFAINKLLMYMLTNKGRPPLNGALRPPPPL